MNSINSFNDFTENDKVLNQWKELIEKSKDRELTEAVNKTLKIAYKDVAIWMALIAGVVLFFFTLFNIWS